MIFPNKLFTVFILLSFPFLFSMSFTYLLSFRNFHMNLRISYFYASDSGSEDSRFISWLDRQVLPFNRRSCRGTSRKITLTRVRLLNCVLLLNSLIARQELKVKSTLFAYYNSFFPFVHSLRKGNEQFVDNTG